MPCSQALARNSIGRACRVCGPWLLVCLCVAPCIGWAAEPGSGKTRDELFLDVFKRPPPDIPISAYVVVAIDGAAPQKLRAVLSRDESALQLEGKPLAQLLSARLRPELVEQLRRRIDGQGWLSRRALEEAGIATAYDPRKFELTVTTAAQSRGKTTSYLNAAPVDLATADAIRPAPLSAFLNYNIKSSQLTQSVAGTTSREHTLGLAVDGALKAQDVVFEGAAFGQAGGGASAFQRGDMRLVVDQPQRAIRYSAGDLRYPVVGYQTVVDMGGVGVSRDYSLQPQWRNYQSGQFEFYLERPAEVKVWVNDSLVSTLQLPAGSHDLRGLAPAIGLNNTRLVIEDSSGRRQTLDFSFISSPMLLERDQSMFSYNAGFRRRLSDGAYRYDTGQPVLSASYLRGVSNVTTLGGYAQADRSRAVAGLQAIHALASSTVQLDAAASRSAGATWDVAARLDWLHLPDTRGPAVQSEVSLEYLGRNFGSINETLPAQRDRINLYSSLSLPLAGATTLRLNGSYTPARDAGRADAYNLAATLVRRWGKWTTTTVSLRTRRFATGERDTGVALGISFSFGDGSGNVYAARESESGATTVAWNSVRPGNAALPYGFASVRAGPGPHEAIAGAGYWGRQGLAEAAQTHREFDSAAGRYRTDETALRMQGSLVFADGAFGLGRSVADNFAIVKGKEGLAGVPIKVDPDSQGGSAASSGWLGPAVVSDLASYQLRELRVEPVDPPIGASPEKLRYMLAPAYKSGFLLELGKEVAMVAVGRLVDGSGQPLPHLPIEIRRIGDAAARPLLTFTGRSGSFQLPDAKPGRYEIRPAATAPWGSVAVDLPQAPDGLLRLGDVRLPAR
ncbi:fimbria/pilus outer membrane usher protein [Caenimonas terrae]|uniref:Fimbria/pilus outer membrane usher protein n=1 Tax=Caenimonas terrae TaxID=696074 RepID=A0ABW0NH51_9BURK